jgi:dCMP deaminase
MRKSWDAYFMDIAREVASRATCDRKHVGCVLVKDKYLIATGYNGSVAGLPHCDEVGHMMVNGHCERTSHAEANAIVQAAKHGVSTDGATAYITASPCWTCFKLLASTGVRRIVYGEFYRDERIFEAAAILGIDLVDASGAGEKAGNA